MQVSYFEEGLVYFIISLFNLNLIKYKEKFSYLFISL
jgi:hypothetical protein